MGTAVSRFVLGVYSAEISNSGAAVFQCVAIEQLAPVAAFGNA